MSYHIIAAFVNCLSISSAIFKSIMSIFIDIALSVTSTTDQPLHRDPTDIQCMEVLMEKKCVRVKLRNPFTENLNASLKRPGG